MVSLWSLVDEFPLKVTTKVIDTVDKIAKALTTFEQSEYPSKTSLVSILRTVQAQVSDTLAREGMVRIRTNSIHVEAVSIDLSEARDSLSFMLEDNGHASERLVPTQSIHNRLVDGSQVKIHSGEIPQGTDVSAAVTLPGNLAESLPEKESTQPSCLVSFLIIK